LLLIEKNFSSMSTLIATLKANPDINTMVAVDEEFILDVISEAQDVHIGSYETGVDLVQKLQQDPDELGSYLFFSEGLVWLLFSGKKRILLVTQNYREMRSFVASTDLPDELRTMMLELLDKIIQHNDQQTQN
jgi:hypothetical protein